MRNWYTYAIAIVSVLAVALLAAGTPGCSKSKAKPLTEAECLEWAKKAEASVRDSQGQFINDSIDAEAMAEKVGSASGKSGDVLRGLKEGVRKGVSSHNLGRQLWDEIKGEGHFGFVRLRKSADGSCWALFRLFSGQRITYDEFDLCRGEDGAVKIQDVHLYAVGQTLSDTLGGMDSRMTNPNDAQDLPKFAQLVKSGQHKEAMELYKTLPPSLQKEKVVMLFKTMALADAEDDVYLKAMDEYRTAFPNDPAGDLISIDWFYLKKRYAECLQCIDRLDQTVGGAPFLDSYRANLAVAQGDIEKGKGLFQRVVKALPDVAKPYWTLVEIALLQKDYKEVAQLLTAIERDLKVKTADLMENTIYAGFVASPEYQEWMKSRVKSKTPPTSVGH